MYGERERGNEKWDMREKETKETRESGKEEEKGEGRERVLSFESVGRKSWTVFVFTSKFVCVCVCLCKKERDENWKRGR